MKSIIDAKLLGEQLLRVHGLTDWKVIFIDARSKFGHCDYLRKSIALERSHVLRHHKTYIKNTILHEIAHALVGPDVKAHGPEWQCQARLLGLSGERMQLANKIVASRKRRR